MVSAGVVVGDLRPTIMFCYLLFYPSVIGVFIATFFLLDISCMAIGDYSQLYFFLNTTSNGEANYLCSRLFKL